ncbi:sorcin [Elysia marginata]|uniref:Sorcin n=1 Tax=Elysia marginata TaxID=1093978 RepID=A0AAV4EL35_9GAST|nr:sorcin [Elysia marginata]
MAYPGYGGAPQDAWAPSAPGPGMDPFYQYFSRVAGSDQQISVLELQKCLNTLGWVNFSLNTCHIILDMLDRDYSEQMGYNEFKEFWVVLKQWKETFDRYDLNRTGYIEGPEFHNALREFGYNLSPQFVGLVLYKFDFETRRKLNFDQFVNTCIMLKGLTDHFRHRDATQTGHAKFNYDDFMQVAVTFAP